MNASTPSGIKEQSIEQIATSIAYLSKLSGHQISTESLLSSISNDEYAELSAWERACRENGLSVSSLESLDNLNVKSFHSSQYLLLFPQVPVSGQKDDHGSLFQTLMLSPCPESDSWLVLNDKTEKGRESKRLKHSELPISADQSALVFEEQNRRVHSSSEGAKVNSKFSAWFKEEVAMLFPLFRDVMLATALVNLFALVSPLFVMNVYDRVVPNQATETLWVLASGVAIVIAFDVFVKFLRLRFVERAGEHLDIVLSSKLFSRVMNISSEYFPSSIGGVVGQLKDFDLIKQFYASSTTLALVEIPFLVIFLLVIYLVGGSLVWVPILAGSLLILYGLFIQLNLRASLNNLSHASTEKTAVLVESIGAVETVQSFNVSARQRKAWEMASIKMAESNRQVKLKSGSIAIFSSAIIQASLVAIVIAGVYQIDAQALSMGGLIACVLLGSRALNPMVQIASLLVHYHHAKTARQALNLLTQSPEDYDAERQHVLLASKHLDISLKNFSYAYPGGKQVLKDISLDIKQGEKVGIIGRIGSGKTSLMRYLLGFGHSHAGSISIGGVELPHLDKKELRQRVAYVSQDIDLLKGTLRDNITLKSPLASQDEVLRCVELAGLSEFVNTQSLGLDMPVGEHGRGLSGGQKQCVSIARALLADPDIFLFDELTSAMDNQSEQHIISSVESIMKNKTLLLSTHRASLLKLVDRIIVIDEGQIIADGEKDLVLNALKRGLIKPGSKAHTNEELQEMTGAKS